MLLTCNALYSGVTDSVEVNLKNEISRLSFIRPDSALRIIDQTLNGQIRDSNFLAFLYGNKGLIYRNSNPDAAVRYLYKALIIYKNIGEKRNVASAYNNIATYGNLPPNRTRTFYQAALKLSNEINDSLLSAQVYNNIGNFYSFRKSPPDSILFYYRKALGYNERLGNIPGQCTNMDNIAEILILQKNYKGAIKYLAKAEEIVPVYRMDIRVSLASRFIELYFKSDKTDSAFYYIHRVSPLLKTFPNKASIIYSWLSTYYTNINNADSALYYDAKSDSIRDYLHSKTTENLLRFLEIEHETKLREETVAKLNAKLDRANIIRLLLIIVILFTITFIYQQRQKNKKKRELIFAKQQQAETELHNSELQRQMLNDELKFTNKELTSFASSIVKNKDHLQGLKDKVEAILEEKSTREMRKQLAELKMEIVQLFQNDEQRKDFIKRSQQVNHALIFYLKSKYPQLNDSDLNLLVLMLLKFTSKEIATLYNIEVDSVGKRRYRLRKKLGITNRQDIEIFFDEVIADFKAVHGKL